MTSDGYFPNSENAFRFQATYPLATGTGLSGLQTNDPAIFILLDFFSNCLRLDCGNRWSELVANLQSKGFASTIPSVFPSPTTASINPYLYMVNNNYQFPLFSMYRDSGKISEYTIQTIIGIESTCEIQFILPAMTAEEAETLQHFLISARDCLIFRATRGYHPSYLGGMFIGTATGLAKLGFSSFRVTNIEGANGLIMPTLVMNLKFQEVNQAVSTNVKPLTQMVIGLILDGYSMHDGYDGYFTQLNLT